MNKDKLKISRNKVDHLDQKILNLIKKRTQIVKYMLSLKKYKNQIVDHKRINTILENVKNKSIKEGVDPKITRRIWTSIICFLNCFKPNIWLTILVLFFSKLKILLSIRSILFLAFLNFFLFIMATN